MKPIQLFVINSQGREAGFRSCHNHWQAMRVKLRRIESDNHRVAVNGGKETTETLITTELTEKKFINIPVVSVAISASVVKIATNHPQRTLNLTRMPGRGLRPLATKTTPAHWDKKINFYLDDFPFSA